MHQLFRILYLFDAVFRELDLYEALKKKVGDALPEERVGDFFCEKRVGDALEKRIGDSS